MIARSCGFKSLHLHQQSSLANRENSRFARLFALRFYRFGHCLAIIFSKLLFYLFFSAFGRALFVRQNVCHHASHLVSCFLEVMGVRRQSSLRGSVAYDINDNSDYTFDSGAHINIDVTDVIPCSSSTLYLLTPIKGVRVSRDSCVRRTAVGDAGFYTGDAIASPCSLSDGSKRTAVSPHFLTGRFLANLCNV